MRLVDWKIISVEKAAGIVQNLSSSIRKDLEDQGIETGLDLKNINPMEPPPIYSLAIGKKDGKQASCGTTFRASDLISMGEATGIPLACGLKLLVDGKILQKGVFAPEGAIDPNDFFNELNKISDLLDVDEENNTNDQEMINIFRSW
jgi:hypothetical protein